MRWHQLGIRQITERAEISRTAFYDFFGSKNEVLEHLIRGLHEDLTLSLREAALDPTGSGGLDLRAIEPGLTAVAIYAERYGHQYRAFLDATAEDADLAALWDELLDEYSELIAVSIALVREREPQAPAELEPALLARTLLLSTERCFVAQQVTPETAGPTVQSLVYLWQQAVFGRPVS